MARRKAKPEQGEVAPNLFLMHSSTRLQRVVEEVRKSEHYDHKQVPGLADLLEAYNDTQVDLPFEDFLRRFLVVFRSSLTDNTYSDVLSQLTHDQSTRLRQFVEEGQSASVCGDGFEIGSSSVAVEEGLRTAKSQQGSNKTFRRLTREIKIYDDAGRTMLVPVYFNDEFENWGKTVRYKPGLTFTPRTTYGVQQIVKYARKHDMNVRASGYRHSWSPIFGQAGQILISTLGLDRVTKLPNIEALPGSQSLEPHTDLSSIMMLNSSQRDDEYSVRLGTAVTNEQLRIWCNTNNVTLPLNAILVEVTVGGLVMGCCHGAGRRHPALSDLVSTVEYIDVNGTLQTLHKARNPEFMATASGCFGLLGIVTHITLTFQSMSYAVLRPKKLPVMRAIPPPPDLADSDIPPVLRIEMTREERIAAQMEFEDNVRNKFYSEFFWFPYTSDVFVSCWNNTKTADHVVKYPSDADVWLQFVQTVLIQILQSSEAILGLQKVLPFTQATLISRLGLDAMPDGITNPGQNVVCRLPDALHFRRCVQNVRVRDMELEIPLQPNTGSLKNAKFDDPIDFSYVQKAWWSAILTAYKYAESSPQRMPLEIRITGPSSTTLGPYKGYNLGTASIEILTLDVMRDEWPSYSQDVFNRWMDLKDTSGNYLNSRPHPTKDWYYLTVRGQPIMDYLKQSYGEQIAEFRNTMEAIAQDQGWDVATARKMFSNDLFNELLFDMQPQHLETAAKRAWRWPAHLLMKCFKPL